METKGLNIEFVPRTCIGQFEADGDAIKDLINDFVKKELRKRSYQEPELESRAVDFLNRAYYACYLWTYKDLVDVSQIKDELKIKFKDNLNLVYVIANILLQLQPNVQAKYLYNSMSFSRKKIDRIVRECTPLKEPINFAVPINLLGVENISCIENKISEIQQALHGMHQASKVQEQYILKLKEKFVQEKDGYEKAIMELREKLCEKDSERKEALAKQKKEFEEMLQEKDFEILQLKQTQKKDVEAVTAQVPKASECWLKSIKDWAYNTNDTEKMEIIWQMLADIALNTESPNEQREIKNKIDELKDKIAYLKKPKAQEIKGDYIEKQINNH